MKKVLKVLSALFVLSLLFAVMALPSSAITIVDDVKITVGGDLAEFDRILTVDYGKGNIRAHFNRFLINEAGVQTLHTTTTHLGIVEFSGRTNSTDEAKKGVWTDRADVRVDSYGTAIYTLAR